MAASALPFRFKAGGGGQSAEGHHHRSSTKVAHKAFKSRHASKGSIKALLKGVKPTQTNKAVERGTEGINEQATHC
jgi:hypothetical protein